MNNNNTFFRNNAGFIPIFLLFFAIQSFGFARETGGVAGSVRDSETAEPLIGTTIRVDERAQGAIANKKGEFSIKSLPVGNQTLLISLLGYETKKIVVEIRSGEITRLDVQLRPQLLQTNEVVVSANKRVQAAQDVPVSISTVDQRALQQRNITRVDDALRYVPGVYMSRDQVNVRGSSGFSLGLGSRVAILLDGFPLLSGDGGDVKFDILPMFSIERVEVIKGAGSALYGTGALGGVVNAITATPTETPDIRLRIFGGGYNAPRYEEWKYRETIPFLGGADIGFSQKFGDFGLLVSGGIKKDESYRDYDDSFRWNIFSKMSYAFSSLSSLKVLVHRAVEDKANWVYWQSLRRATSPPLSVDRDQRLISRKLHIAGEWNQVLDDTFFFWLKSTFLQTDFETINPITNVKDSLSSVANSWNTELQCSSVFSRGLLLTYGANILLNATPESFLGEKRQTIASGYAQAEYSPISSLTLTAGGRIDYEKTTPNAPATGEIIPAAVTEINPKFGLSFSPNEETRFRLSAGRGFRAPTLGERYANVRYGGVLQTIPNLGLQPEQSWSYELGGNRNWTLFGEKWSLDGAVFWNDFYNLVEPNLVGANIQFVNVTRARIQGVEIGINGWLPSKIVGVEFSLTLMNPKDVDSNLTLKYRSVVLFQNRCIIPLSSVFQLQTDYRFQSKFERVDDTGIIATAVTDAGARVPIHVVDARISANLYSAWQIPVLLTLNVKNVLDYYYNEIIGNLAPMRSITLQAEMKL